MSVKVKCKMFHNMHTFFWYFSGFTCVMSWYNKAIDWSDLNMRHKLLLNQCYRQHFANITSIIIAKDWLKQIKPKCITV